VNTSIPTCGKAWCSYMRYIIDIPKWLDIKIKKILADETKEYSSIEEFILVACENQVKLENIEEEKMESFEEKSSEIKKSDELKSISRISNLLLEANINTIPTVELPKTGKVETELLWGQINRIFPIKIGVRVLANMIKESNNTYIELEPFREVAADIARKFGLRLKEIDEKYNRRVGKRFSTGLPIGRNAELSKNRYKAHYLAYQTGKGTLVGALADLRFVDIEGDKIGITEKGLEFARINNPLLDIFGPESNEILSEKEIKFYLSLIKEFLPKEDEFMKAVLSMIEEGEPPREEFNAKVKAFIEEIWDETVTPAVANTMRSGVLSRMWELGFVNNKKVGKKIVYSITEKGRRFLHGGN